MDLCGGTDLVRKLLRLFQSSNRGIVQISLGEGGGGGEVGEGDCFPCHQSWSQFSGWLKSRILFSFYATPTCGSTTHPLSGEVLMDYVGD